MFSNPQSGLRNDSVLRRLLRRGGRVFESTGSGNKEFLGFENIHKSHTVAIDRVFRIPTEIGDHSLRRARSTLRGLECGYVQIPQVLEIAEAAM